MVLVYLTQRLQQHGKATASLFNSFAKHRYVAVRAGHTGGIKLPGVSLIFIFQFEKFLFSRKKLKAPGISPLLASLWFVDVGWLQFPLLFSVSLWLLVAMKIVFVAYRLIFFCYFVIWLDIPKRHHSSIYLKIITVEYLLFT